MPSRGPAGALHRRRPPGNSEAVTRRAAGGVADLVQPPQRTAELLAARRFLLLPAGTVGLGLRRLGGERAHLQTHQAGDCQGPARMEHSRGGPAPAGRGPLAQHPLLGSKPARFHPPGLRDPRRRPGRPDRRIRPATAPETRRPWTHLRTAPVLQPRTTGPAHPRDREPRVEPIHEPRLILNAHGQRHESVPMLATSCSFGARTTAAS